MPLSTSVEVQVVRIVETHNPGRSYPLATGLGALIAPVIFAFGAVITDVRHPVWLTQMLSLLVGLGAITGMFAWLGGPPRAR